MIEARRARSASTAALAAAAQVPTSKRRVVATCLALTWLNPHVYLDTVVLLGTISTRFGAEAGSFAAGAMTGSFLFFFALGYGAAWLRPVFATPTAWRILEAVIALVMWAIAAKILLVA
jgi:L-lysine exporter family protein LysE/ArgO